MIQKKLTFALLFTLSLAISHSHCAKELSVNFKQKISSFGVSSSGTIGVCLHDEPKLSKHEIVTTSLIPKKVITYKRMGENLLQVKTLEGYEFTKSGFLISFTPPKKSTIIKDIDTERVLAQTNNNAHIASYLPKNEIFLWASENSSQPSCCIVKPRESLIVAAKESHAHITSCSAFNDDSFFVSHPDGAIRIIKPETNSSSVAYKNPSNDFLDSRIFDFSVTNNGYLGYFTSLNQLQILKLNKKNETLIHKKTIHLPDLLCRIHKTSRNDFIVMGFVSRELFLINPKKASAKKLDLLASNEIDTYFSITPDDRIVYSPDGYTLCVKPLY